MNYKLRIFFPSPPKDLPDFERIFIRDSLRGVVADANDFLGQTGTRLLSYIKQTGVGAEHAETSIRAEGRFRIAICPETGDGPLQIMEFTETKKCNYGERVNTFNPPSKVESRTKNQDTLKYTLDSVPNFNTNDIVMLKQQIELAQKERDRNLRYSAIDKLQDIRERYAQTHTFVPAVESMFDEMLGALMNLRS